MQFWPFKTSETQSASQDNKNGEPSTSKNFSQIFIFQQHLQDFINNNLPVDFAQKFNKTKPYILASFVAWPIFWLYRGLEWSNHRHNARLPMYIQKTYLQAKFMQFSIIMFGLTVASLMENTGSELSSENISNKIKR